MLAYAWAWSKWCMGSPARLGCRLWVCGIPRAADAFAAAINCMEAPSIWLIVFARGRIAAPAVAFTPATLLFRARLWPWPWPWVTLLALSRRFRGLEDGVVDWCSFCWWRSSRSRRAKHLVHSGHSNGFSLVWERSWRFKCSNRAKDRRQVVQTCGRGLSVFGGGKLGGALVFTVMDEALQGVSGQQKRANGSCRLRQRAAAAAAAGRGWRTREGCVLEGSWCIPASSLAETFPAAAAVGDELDMVAAAERSRWEPASDKMVMILEKEVQGRLSEISRSEEGRFAGSTEGVEAVVVGGRKREERKAREDGGELAAVEARHDSGGGTERRGPRRLIGGRETKGKPRARPIVAC